jgi:anti-sigma factor RsiW
MNCRSWESLIALYIEGDLSASELSRVVSHMDGCPACRYFADELRESQSVFKSLRTGTVDTADLSDVRQRVLNEVGDLDPAPGWVVTMHRLFFAGLRRRNAIAGVLMTALIAGGVWYSQIPSVHDANPVRESKQADAIELANLVSPVPAELQNGTPPRIVHSHRIVKPEEPRKASDVLSEDSSVQSSNHVESADSDTSQIIPFKFVTDDPDIIIYWIPTDKGD